MSGAGERAPIVGFSGPPGSRSRHLGIKRPMRTTFFYSLASEKPIFIGFCVQCVPWLSRNVRDEIRDFPTRSWSPRFNNGQRGRGSFLRRSKKSLIALVHGRSATSTFCTRPFELEFDSVFGSKHKRRHTGSRNSIHAVTAQQPTIVDYEEQDISF